jgi:hypothetical protein
MLFTITSSDIFAQLLPLPVVVQKCGCEQLLLMLVCFLLVYYSWLVCGLTFTS